jgi:hypothetical protein
VTDVAPPAVQEVLLAHRWVGAQYQCLCQVLEEPSGDLNADDTIDESDWVEHLMGQLAGAGWTVQRTAARVGAVVTVRAGDLCGEHVGWLVSLPGRYDEAADCWLVTTAPIVQVLHRRDGRVKVRRHPDGHVDHTLDPGTLLELVVR